MHTPAYRRQFLAATGLTTSFGGVGQLFSQVPLNVVKEDEKRFKPDTLFLTWQQDPTTTMTVQWIGKAKQVDEPTILYRDRGKGDGWVIGPTCKATPFPVVETASIKPEK